jgi:hypothetical protein
MRRLAALAAALTAAVVLAAVPASALDDVDGDGVEPPKDKCPTVAAPGRSHGCPIVARELTRSYAPIDHVFAGVLTAPSKALRARQTVYLYQRKLGKDPLVATGRTRANGSYVVRHAATKATYYLKVKSAIDPATGKAKKIVTEDLVLHAVS